MSEQNKNLTVDSNNSGNSESPFEAYFKTLKRFILCRTKSIGWQARGYVLLDDMLQNAASGNVYPGTIWVEDNDKKYRQGDVYPLPPDEAA
ncbi:hypothetical protein DTI93_06650 [Parasaccharibacter sp. TMW 2.1884]|uniref:hypothetical protein n=1 Tax=Parasaccharibacter sp. TMW 2.1884 TaxID=2267834 RepID=UPI0020113EFD|nr:hypothetical protein [Parasaccharibacter sp. TMW 2.1884]MCL1512063.1 hypothetical protein [Parasaccharibacter sp. TMW 2.1884]